MIIFFRSHIATLPFLQVPVGYANIGEAESGYLLPCYASFM